MERTRRAVGTHVFDASRSPYLEDLTKSLVVSQPSRRKLQLVPPRRSPPLISPYESLGARAPLRIHRVPLRIQLQV